MNTYLGNKGYTILKNELTEEQYKRLAQEEKIHKMVYGHTGLLVVQIDV